MTYDIAEVNVDSDDNIFAVIRTNGTVQIYDLDEERDLYNKIITYLQFAGGFPVYSLSSEEVDEYGNRYYQEE